MNETAMGTNSLILRDGQALISSRLIAYETEKEHKNVIQQIEQMFNRAEISAQLENGGYDVIESEYATKDNRTSKEYLLNKKAFTFYCFNIQGFEEFKMAYINRFEEMEKELSQPAPVLTTEQLLAQALIAANKVIAQTSQERDEAVRTKAWIGSKREATAMSTASQKSKENKTLRLKLDETSEYATVKRVLKATGIEYKYGPLRSYCLEHGLEIQKVPDVNYGFVNSYPAQAWYAVHGVDIKALFRQWA